MSEIKIPRPGTRVRAVFDRLYADTNEGMRTLWSEAKSAYDNHTPAHNAHSKQYSGMELARILRKYADRMERGQYRMKEDYHDLVDGKCHDDYPGPAPADIPDYKYPCKCRRFYMNKYHDDYTFNDPYGWNHSLTRCGPVEVKSIPPPPPPPTPVRMSIFCSCGSMEWTGQNKREDLIKLWPNGYTSLTDRGLHFLDGRQCIPKDGNTDLEQVIRNAIKKNTDQDKIIEDLKRRNEMLIEQNKHDVKRINDLEQKIADIINICYYKTSKKV